MNVIATDPEAFRLISLRRGLKFQAETGMQLTRIPLLPVARQYGVTKRTYAGAYKELNDMMVSAGFQDTGPLKPKK